MNPLISREIFSSFKGKVLFDEPLSKYTYYRIGGPASCLAIPTGIEDLKILKKIVKEDRLPHFFMGNGSNLLVADGGYGGLVIKTTHMNREFSVLENSMGRVKIRVGSGLLVSTLLGKAMKEGWNGLNFLAGIPGTMGGVLFMNGGTHLGEIADIVSNVGIFSFDSKENDEIREISGSKIRYEYRNNLFLNQGDVILYGDLVMGPETLNPQMESIESTLARRKESQPLEYPSCGSVFKNPYRKSDGVQMRAWEVIDKIGLRGHRIGGAGFSEKHSNFIVNYGGATAQDVCQLINLAKQKAKELLHLDLEEEVQYLGF